MGTPIDRQPVGRDCPFCWGAGKPYAGEPTPYAVHCLIAGVLPLDPGPWVGAGEQRFDGVLSQIEPCKWQGKSGSYTATWYPASTGAVVMLHHADYGLVYYSVETYTCDLFGSQADAFIAMYGWTGGSHHITLEV